MSVYLITLLMSVMTWWASLFGIASPNHPDNVFHPYLIDASGQLTGPKPAAAQRITDPGEVESILREGLSVATRPTAFVLLSDSHTHPNVPTGAQHSHLDEKTDEYSTRIGGNDYCNIWGADAHIDSAGFVHIGEVISTKAGCGDFRIARSYRQAIDGTVGIYRDGKYFYLASDGHFLPMVKKPVASIR